MLNKEAFILEVMNGKVLDEIGVAKFKKYYKEILEEGKYIGRRQGEYVISDKYPEKNAKQKDKYDEFMQSLFVRV